MLTADLVLARRKGDTLVLTKLDGRRRARAVEIAQELVAIASASVGLTREELGDALRSIPVGASERKLADGLRKLIEDRTEFEMPSAEDPQALRAAVFQAASASRKALDDGQVFDRAAVMQRVAEAHGIAAEQLEGALYADLRGAHRVTSFAAISAPELVASYDTAQRQAVLLRAERLSAEVRCADAYAYRALFRKLKFHRLMHRIAPLPGGGYRIEIDGPFSLFSASTKYGLALALALPALLSCDRYVIKASLRWGKEKKPLAFAIEGSAGSTQTPSEPHLPDEVQTFLERFAKLDSPWQASASSDILEVPGAGLCVPDVRFLQPQTGEVAYLEVMGYWSRDAVWKRVELVQTGLQDRVIFAVSKRLRVSEEVLEPDSGSALYVYKGAIAPKEILARLDG